MQMTHDVQHKSAPRHAKGEKSDTKIVLKVIVGLLSIALVSVVLFIAYLFISSQNVATYIASDLDESSHTTYSDETKLSQNPRPDNIYTELRDRSEVVPANTSAPSEETSQTSQARESQASDTFPIPLIAEYDGVLIHSPIHPNSLEAILFHQASFETALVLSTQLEAADPEAMLENPNYEIAAEQATGDEWLNALALHLWREDTPTQMDTSIDVGAEAGTEVYAPVSGTVVLVKTYKLYDVCDDYEIHIQPDGRPDLDLVEIHVSDVTVKAGDKVIGGVTPMAKVRNLAAEDITDIQLAFYTKEGHGNHTHVQVNNADYPEYRETRLKDAYKVE